MDQPDAPRRQPLHDPLLPLALQGVTPPPWWDADDDPFAGQVCLGKTGEWQGTSTSTRG